jgi:hypothetical protein
MFAMSHYFQQIMARFLSPRSIFIVFVLLAGIYAGNKKAIATCAAMAFSG